MPDAPSSTLGPLDVPEWERRSPIPRRGDDRTLLERCKGIVGHLAQLLSIAVVAVGIVAWCATLLGVRLTGTPQAIATLAQHDSALTTRVTRLEQGAIRLENTMTFQSYLLCKQSRGADVVAVNRCDTIIKDWLSRGAP